MDKICPSYKSSSRSRTTILFSASSLLIHSSKFYKVQLTFVCRYRLNGLHHQHHYRNHCQPWSDHFTNTITLFSHSHHHLLLTLPSASVQLPFSYHFTKYNQHNPYHKSTPTSHNFTTLHHQTILPQMQSTLSVPPYITINI
jgi:hypothetical protein